MALLMLYSFSSVVVVCIGLTTNKALSPFFRKDIEYFFFGTLKLT